MQYVSKSQAKTHANSPQCTAIEYPTLDTDINGAVIELHGRFPETGMGKNTVCKELCYVVSGSATITLGGAEQVVNQGDVVLINVGEQYFWEGECTLFVSSTPSWTMEQYVIK